MVRKSLMLSFPYIYFCYLIYTLDTSKPNLLYFSDWGFYMHALIYVFFAQQGASAVNTGLLLYYNTIIGFLSIRSIRSMVFSILMILASLGKNIPRVVIGGVQI